MKPTAREIQTFQAVVWQHYAANRREMPWRQDHSPYRVMVSEIMLQQTQVDRVRPKFLAFMAKFPEVQVLAAVPLAEVLAAWTGLGYNRRAKFLHESAKAIVARFDGSFPRTLAELVTLPGIGPNTAGAILAYAYNQPVVFIETNIRSVIIHHFFAKEEQVSDVDIRAVATACLDSERPREWHWALMDYGSYVKKAYGNNVHRAKSHHRQSTFQGSHRQIRGQIIQLLIAAPRSIAELSTVIVDDRLAVALAELESEKLITTRNNHVQLAK